jgi:hypothetical protein
MSRVGRVELVHKLRKNQFDTSALGLKQARIRQAWKALLVALALWHSRCDLPF